MRRAEVLRNRPQARRTREKPGLAQPTVWSVGGPETMILPVFLSSRYAGPEMRYEIILSHVAVADLHQLKAHDRAAVRDAMETHLRCEPMKLSKSRIKGLRGMTLFESASFACSAEHWLREAGIYEEGSTD